MKKIQLEGGGMPELFNPTSNVTRLSQMTPHPLGLQIPPSGALGAGDQGDEVNCPPPQMLFFKCISI